MSKIVNFRRISHLFVMWLKERLGRLWVAFVYLTGYYDRKFFILDTKHATKLQTYRRRIIELVRKGYKFNVYLDADVLMFKLVAYKPIIAHVRKKTTGKFDVLEEVVKDVKTEVIEIPLALVKSVLNADSGGHPMTVMTEEERFFIGKIKEQAIKEYTKDIKTIFGE